MQAEKLVRVLVRVLGEVQGVGFRYAVWREAKACAISGWVSNEPDGSVYILAESKREVLEDFVQWCKMGPTWARIEKVTVEWRRGTGEFKEFSIH